MTPAALWHEPLVQAAVWSLATILLYLLAKREHRKRGEALNHIGSLAAN
ncbi:hypothetical protein ACQR14_15195 [Bradyrhizobium oligotrophicum]